MMWRYTWPELPLVIKLITTGNVWYAVTMIIIIGLGYLNLPLLWVAER